MNVPVCHVVVSIGIRLNYRWELSRVMVSSIREWPVEFVKIIRRSNFPTNISSMLSVAINSNYKSGAYHVFDFRVYF